MAMVIIQSIMKNNTCISTFDKVAVLFELIKGLIMDLDGTTLDDVDEEDFNEEQNCVARLIRMLHNDEPEEMFKITIIMFIVKLNCIGVSLLSDSYNTTHSPSDNMYRKEAYYEWRTKELTFYSSFPDIFCTKGIFLP
ncbi:hypothetical protein JHK85_024869 [Glycine max]|nr:hypothetical protein JHK85_024869 [Glycine max]